jgi:uncharacterized membrane protein YfcA
MASLLKILTFLAVALLVYGGVLHMLRTKIHESFARLSRDRQARLLVAWRRLFAITRIFLILGPAIFIVLVLLLQSEFKVAISTSAPLLVLMYLNITLIHVNRRWHARALTSILDRTDANAAA